MDNAEMMKMLDDSDDFLADVPRQVDLDELFGNKSDVISKELKAEIAKRSVPFEILAVTEKEVTRKGNKSRAWYVDIKLLVSHANAAKVREDMPADGVCIITFDKGIASRDTGFEKLKEHLPYKYARLESKPTSDGNTFYMLRTFKDEA